MAKISSSAYLLGLSLIPGLGPARIKILQQHFPDPAEVWGLSEKSLRALKLPEGVASSILEYRKKIDLEGELAKLSKAAIKIITLLDDDYPPLLREIYDPPPVLYVRGNLRPLAPKIAVVGTRLMTVYGHQVTESLTRDLVGTGLTIVSGLARGVDAMAHRTALAAGGETIAVLGSGLNQVYPPENKHLAEEIAQQGAVISEYPPAVEAARGTFPARNRIISGLSLGVVVTEAGEDSGSLITANSAAEQGRLVFSVPGPVNSRQSAGANSLIKVGAKLVTSTEDILDELNLAEKIVPQEMVAIKPANSTEGKILETLTAEPTHFDDLVRTTKLPAGKLGSALTVMVISGKVADLGGNFYARNH